MKKNAVTPSQIIEKMIDLHLQQDEIELCGKRSSPHSTKLVTSYPTTKSTLIEPLSISGSLPENGIIPLTSSTKIDTSGCSKNTSETLMSLFLAEKSIG
jgi:hypothetical protein